MDRWLPRRFSFRKRLSLLLLVILLTSCGSVASSASSNTNTPIGATSTADGSQNLEPAYNYDKSQTISGLFIKLDGFICTEGPYLSNLTIATSRLSYDAGSAQIIQNYLQLLADGAVVPPYALYAEWIPPQPPKELQWIPGSTKCTGNIAITNTTHTSIEVQRFSIQLTAAPTINSYHYQRILIEPHCNGCGGRPSCAYGVSITLNGGAIGSQFEGPITSTDSVQCPLPITIPALGSTELSITLQDAQRRNVIYAGMPMLTIESQEPIALSALTSRLSFTQTDRLPCYQFQENSFVPCLHP